MQVLCSKYIIGEIHPCAGSRGHHGQCFSLDLDDLEGFFQPR